ncbi:MAG: 2-phospho-L-lactate transferase [Methanoregula sp.]|jgi:LPPG:FO 2-phospho-L-lactate transferase
MITFLSGGTGTPKLLRGMQKVMDPKEISVVVNTADDIWISGNHISPDLDTVMYLFAGILNTDTWWGIRGDTFSTHEALSRLSDDEYIAIGDQDRAVHIARGNGLRHHVRLTEITKSLSLQFKVTANVLPMTDTTVTTKVRKDALLVHYQEYWVKSKGQCPIQQVVYLYGTPPIATQEVIEAVEKSDAVVIGPSNPITSIMPILICEGLTDAMEDKCVIAISPFIGDAPVSGPAAALMKAQGREPNSKGTFSCYGNLVDLRIQDIRDPVEVEGAIRLDTLMTNEEKSVKLAREILDIIACR